MVGKTVKLLILTILCALIGLAQQDRGTIVGTVTDPSGSVMPNVKVTVRHVETGTVFNSQTNAAGQYRVLNLPIGSYRVTFESQGFKLVNRENIQLNVAQVLAVDAQLQVGNVAETVEVTAQATLLNTETPEVGTVLESKTVNDLPLGFSGGRYAENFAYKLTPGVGGDNWTSHINGAPSFSKEVILDGASATVYISGHMGESSPSMEALQEFKVQTSGMSAEYTRTSGGVFNFVMKSGANDYHGSGVYQWHNESFDANTFANNFYGRPRRLDRRDDWAVSLGGPVGIPKLKTFKDKWFWYAAYEKYNEKYAGGGSPTVTMPTTSWLSGDLSSYLTDQVIGTDALGRSIYRGQIFDPNTTRVVNGQIVRDPFPGNIIPQNRSRLYLRT